MSGAAVIRAAIREDCRRIAELFRISSEGIADYIWSKLAGPGEALIDVGAARYARENTAFSYQNCLVAEIQGRVVGMVHSFVLETTQAHAEPEPDPVLRPYGELELPGSLYLSGLALLPAHRGRGIGTRLLGEAHRRARELGLETVSLIVFEANRSALRLYQRHGYREIDRRPIVPHELIHATGNALLMVRAPD